MTELYSTEEFERKYTYSGSDLGARWTKDKTLFRLWAPTAKSVKVNLYKSGNPGGSTRSSSRLANIAHILHKEIVQSWE